VSRTRTTGAGAAEIETTKRRNRRALDRLAIAQNVLVDVRHIDLSTRPLGVPPSWPVAVAPMAPDPAHRRAMEMARGCGRADTLQFLPAPPAGRWRTSRRRTPGRGCSSLYHHGDRGWVAELLARRGPATCRCLTVDVQVYGAASATSSTATPRATRCRRRRIRAARTRSTRRLTWDDVEWLKKSTRLPVGIKGIMTVRDARRAVEMGVDLIWASNHAAGSSIQTQATIDALPPIAEAVAGRASIRSTTASAAAPT
jgi:isopentenyl diphosphate isomerase/L-lactate dehydrogenase-like FMN-dependent dehydrogenase